MATVKSHIYKGKMVHAIYSDVVDAALTAGITAEEIIALIEVESGEEVPALKELRALNVSCKPLKPARESEESGESGESEKYLVRAVLRYVPEAEESESL